MAIHHGRLLEVRIASPVTPAELGPFAQRLRELLTSRAERIVICTDLTGANVFPPAVADAFVEMMRADNPRVERSAFLVGDSAMFGLQIERMLREAGNPARRSFRDRDRLAAWLGEVLSEREVTQLQEFLGTPG